MTDHSCMLFNCQAWVALVLCAVDCLGSSGLVGALHRVGIIYCSVLRVSGFFGYPGICELLPTLDVYVECFV